MEIVKTICPRCFKIFSVLSSDEMDKVKCDFCEYMYELPRFDVKNDSGGMDYSFNRYFNS